MKEKKKEHPPKILLSFFCGVYVNVAVVSILRLKILSVHYLLDEGVENRSLELSLKNLVRNNKSKVIDKG